MRWCSKASARRRGPGQRHRQPGFGTIITASGSSHTWAANNRENRLTSFANDPVSDPTAEALFIRDDDVNRPGVARRLSVIADNDWVLGPPRDDQGVHVVTRFDAATGAVPATQP